MGHVGMDQLYETVFRMRWLTKHLSESVEYGAEKLRQTWVPLSFVSLLSDAQCLGQVHAPRAQEDLSLFNSHFSLGQKGTSKSILTKSF